MKGYRIQLSNVQMEDAMEQLELLQGIDHKQANCLRLLCEEMFAMMASVLEKREADFEIQREDKAFTLTLKANALVSSEAREEFMSMSSDGKNIAYRGIKGKMIQMMESYAEGCNAMPVEFGLQPECGDYAYLWQLSLYMDQVSKNEQEKAWDGMEKSIILNFADDVLIGVRKNSLEMIVKKAF